MSLEVRRNHPGKLPALVESDFDQTRLLQLIAEEPDEPLYRTVYKALYADEHAGSRPPLFRMTAASCEAA